MNSFEWYNPTKIIFGEDSFEKISKEIPKNARILMTLNINNYYSYYLL
jgi:NADP-dependent alcohol dehydrogenase